MVDTGEFNDRGSRFLFLILKFSVKGSLGADSSATPGSVLVLVLRYRAGDLLAGPFPDLAHALFLGLLRHEFRVAKVGGDRSDATDTFYVVDDCLGHT